MKPDLQNMQSLVSPEVWNKIWRWRETLFGIFMSCCGMFLAVSQQGVMAAFGTSIAIVGALIVFAGIQRTRFRVGAGGPGIVQVDLSQVTYYGPHNGGSVSIDSLEVVELDPTTTPAQWVLLEAGGQPLHIPTNAGSAELLFDVFAGLEGIKTGDMLAKLRSKPTERVMIWHETQRRLH